MIVTFKRTNAVIAFIALNTSTKLVLGKKIHNLRKNGLALLRAGTDSIIARDIGIRGSRERGLRKLLHWARTKDGKSVILKRPIMRVQTSSQPLPFFGMIFGAAAIYQGIRFCRRNIHTLGLHGELAPGLTLARFLLGVIRKKRQYVTAHG